MKLLDFGATVAKLRQKTSLSAYELSLRLSKDASYISKLENGKMNPSLTVIILLAKELNVDIKDLFNV